jgi:aminomethyltransferase
METIQKTPLYEFHKKLNGNIVNYHGVYLPVFYSSIQDEHNSVRNKAGIFDVSHMGVIGIKFKNRDAAVRKFNYLFANDYSKIVPGKVIYSTMLDHNGCPLDDLFVMSLTENEYLVIVNFGNKIKDFDWISSNLDKNESVIENYFDTKGIIAVQGPETYAVLKDGVGLDIEGLKRFGVKKVKYGSGELVVSRTGYTGEDGFEIYVDNSMIEKLFVEILEKGKDRGMKPCGLGCRDTLRLESSYPLYGQELDENHSPLQSMISWSVKMGKPDDFIGKKALLNAGNGKFTDIMIGFEVIGRSIPRTGMEILDAKGAKIGYVTSGTFSPTLKKNIGIAYIGKEYSSSHDLFINIRNKTESISVIEMPFYKRSTT